MTDFHHVLKRIFTEFAQMVFFSRQYSRHGDPGILVHINYDDDQLSVSHDGESYTHQEVYDFLGRQVPFFNSFNEIVSLVLCKIPF